jgi:hypothetical protein
MFSAFKMVRAAIPFDYSSDDYIDGRNYMDFAEETDEKNNGKIS